MEDPYVVLGLKADASERDVASAYRRAALKYHPDKNIGDPNAEAMFARVYAAYEILSSEEKRKEVDARRKADVQREERMRDMDVKRREMKEQLERRESQAKLEDEEKTNVQRKKKQISEETMARMRREIERLRREMEEEEHRREENANRSLRDAAVKKSTSVPYTILIRWDAEQARTESFLRSILETYVDDKALTFDVSRKGAMVTLTSPQMFKKIMALKKELRKKGLKIKGTEPPESVDTTTQTTTSTTTTSHAALAKQKPMQCFDDFEADVLTMMQNSSTTKAGSRSDKS